MNTWVLVSIIVFILILLTIGTMILTKTPILRNGDLFPTSSLKITNRSSMTFDSITCYDTSGTSYTPLQGISTPRAFPPNDSFSVPIQYQTSLLCIAMKNGVEYVTILGQMNTFVEFMYLHTDATTFTFTPTTDIPRALLAVPNPYKGLITTPTISSKLLTNGDPFPTSLVLTNCASDPITFTTFGQIDLSVNLSIAAGTSCLPITISTPPSSYCFLLGTIQNTQSVLPYHTGIALFNNNHVIEIIPIGNKDLIVSRPYLMV